MQNPFTTTYSKLPEYTYVSTSKTGEILENFSYEYPSEAVYKIAGVRGSGKTVILAKVEEELKNDESTYNEWIVVDLNPTRDMLQQLASKLEKEGLVSKKSNISSVSVSANVLGTGGGIGVARDNNTFFDIGTEIDGMLELAQKKGKKVLIGVDEVSKTKEMIEFTMEMGRWLRAGYPVYMICTGLYENLTELSNVKNLTFFRRATTIKTEPLNTIRMAEMYKTKLEIGTEIARELAELTKGYAYAFQQLGVLYFRNGKKSSLESIVGECKTELFAYSYEKIWEELSAADQDFLRLVTDKDEYKREEVLRLMEDKANNYSVYRDRLIKRGILNARQGYISLALPFFGEYVKTYCV